MRRTNMDVCRARMDVSALVGVITNKYLNVYGFVIMPNHIHLIWKINEQYLREDVQRDFLKYTAQQIKFDLQKNYPKVLEHFEVNLKDRKYQIWERNPLSIDIYTRQVLEQKLDYIHRNPIQDKWKLSDIPENYFFSSADYYLANNQRWDFITHYMEHC